jgi:hypothetical protein
MRHYARMEPEIPSEPAWKQPFPTGGHGNGMESISTYFILSTLAITHYFPVKNLNSVSPLNPNDPALTSS